jgi:hypothetical protein
VRKPIFNTRFKKQLMQKLNLLLPCLLLCGAFAQAQNLNDFNDVRPLCVLLNPAHIGLEGAKGELGVVYQLNTNAFYVNTSNALSLYYVHHFKIKEKNILNLGITTENQILGTRYSTTSNGVNIGYAIALNTKNSLSVGTTISFSAAQGSYMNIQCTQDCPYRFGYTTTIATGINAGIVWKTLLGANTALKLGFAGHNINTPMNYYTVYRNEVIGLPHKVIRLPTYFATLDMDFMVNKRIGLSPMLMVKKQTHNYHTIVDNLYSCTMRVGSDINYKINAANTISIGYTQQFLPLYLVVTSRQAATFSLRYNTKKIDIGLAYTTILEPVFSIGGDLPSYQLGIKYSI